MRNKGTAGLIACALVWAALACAPALGASDASGANAKAGAAAPPATAVPPAVARLSLIQSGSVVITSTDGKTKTLGTLNAALMPGDAFATTADTGTRAEIQLDGFTSLRLAGGVAGTIASNDAGARRIQITAGLIDLAVLRGGNVATEIVTPMVTLRTHYAGDYRISVDADGSTSATARSGQLDAQPAHGKTSVLVACQTLVARGDPADPTISVRTEIAKDSFDAFNAARDHTLLDALESDTHVPASIAAYDDLDSYGRWTDLASYGDVWVPQQNAGWAPYRDGQWTSQPGYGMTWVGNEPWGWVPYHYGRWLYANGVGWCWYPPALGLSPIWAPGLVGFFGYGSGPLGYSGFGWVPLAPYEAYYPWYPWYLYGGGSKFGGRRYYPPPPAPPRGRHHQGPPEHMHALSTAFHNAQFGGASAVGASAWHEGNFSHPIAVDPRRVGSTVTIVHGRLPVVAAPANAQSTLKRVAPTMSTQSASQGSSQALSGAAPAWQLEFERAASVLSAPNVPAGGGSAASAHPASPVMRSTLPVMRTPGSPGTGTGTTPPVMHGGSPAIHPSDPVMRTSMPVMRDSGPIQTRQSGPSHGSSRPPA